MPRRKMPIFFDELRRMHAQRETIVLPYYRLPRKRVKLLLALGAGLALVSLAFSVFVVDETEAVLVVNFGRPVREIFEPGLHVKWPWQGRRRFDRRLQLDTPTPRPMMTKDRRALDVAWYASWKVADVGRFVKTVGTRADASARLEDMVSSVLASKLARIELPDLVKVGGVSVVETLMNEVTVRVAEQSEKEYGLKVVDVRLRRLNFPEGVRPAVYEQTRSERQRLAAAIRAEGESQARLIRSAADLDRARALAEAEGEATRVVGEGEAQAARIANDAYAADPAFYQFLKTLEAYRKALGSRTTLVLSADSAFLRLLTEGVPGLEQPPGPLVLPTLPSSVPSPSVVTPLKPAPEPTRPAAVNPPAEASPAPAPARPPVAAPARPPVGPPASGPARSTAVRPKTGAGGTRPPVTGTRP